MEALRRGDEFKVYIDLPGVVPDDIDLTVERNVVSVRVRRAPISSPGARPPRRRGSWRRCRGPRSAKITSRATSSA
jgi:HSP20 family molecular chaperone IbpA